jgi:hypothetical protein
MMMVSRISSCSCLPVIASTVVNSMYWCCYSGRRSCRLSQALPVGFGNRSASIPSTNRILGSSRGMASPLVWESNMRTMILSPSFGRNQVSIVSSRKACPPPQLHDHGYGDGDTAQRGDRVHGPGVFTRGIRSAGTPPDHRTIRQPHSHGHAQESLLLYLVIQKPLQGRTYVGLFRSGRFRLGCRFLLLLGCGGSACAGAGVGGGRAVQAANKRTRGKASTAGRLIVVSFLVCQTNAPLIRSAHGTNHGVDGDNHATHTNQRWAIIAVKDRRPIVRLPHSLIGAGV